MSQKRVLPEPDEPIPQKLRLRALAGFLGRLFIISRSVCVSSTLFSNTGSMYGRYPRACPMKRFVKCFFELLTQIIVKVRKRKVQRVCVLHFQLAVSGGCFFLMKLYH